MDSLLVSREVYGRLHNHDSEQPIDRTLRFFSMVLGKKTHSMFTNMPIRLGPWLCKAHDRQCQEKPYIAGNLRNLGDLSTIGYSHVGRSSLSRRSTSRVREGRGVGDAQLLARCRALCVIVLSLGMGEFCCRDPSDRTLAVVGGSDNFRAFALI